MSDGITCDMNVTIKVGLRQGLRLLKQHVPIGCVGVTKLGTFPAKGFREVGDSPPFLLLTKRNISQHFGLVIV